MKAKWIVLAPLAFLGILLFIALGGGIVMLLWNWLLPPLFGWPTITFWQALGLLALCRILFGGFGGSRGYRSKVRRRIGERCESLTPEERERFRQRMRERMRERWGLGPSDGEGESGHEHGPAASS
jgi:hypothetical protein